MWLLATESHSTDTWTFLSQEGLLDNTGPGTWKAPAHLSPLISFQCLPCSQCSNSTAFSLSQTPFPEGAKKVDRPHIAKALSVYFILQGSGTPGIFRVRPYQSCGVFLWQYCEGCMEEGQTGARRKVLSRTLWPSIFSLSALDGYDTLL